MAFYVSETGCDGADRLNFDSLGKLYIGLAIIWTMIIIFASGFLLYNRDLPALRVRNTHLWTSAVGFLHAYWVLCLLAYVLNGTYPCTAEFWVMNLWLPFGMALFQVNGIHLLHIASLQTRFINPQALHAYRGSRSAKSGWWSLRNLGLPDSLSRVQKISIMAGLILQIVISLVIFSVSRKFHPSWGVIGQAVGPRECQRGWEWIPSIVWQFFWAWIYAPYLLWKVRQIHDLHGWRLQTIISCIGGLLGSPMWLFALYSPYFSSGLARVSRYFVPPLWFTPGIVAMEVSVIFIPCIMVLRSRKLQRETLQEILDWERNQGSGTSVDTSSTFVQKFDDYRMPSPAPSSRPIRNELYSMKALEKALTTNITPLLRFSALKDFSAENISFLKHVQEWRANWTMASINPAQPRFPFSRKSNNISRPRDLASLQRQQFAYAVEIYATFISRQYSDFPINISCPQYKDLEAIFAHAASTLDVRPHDNIATPFDSFPCPDTAYLDDIEKHSDSSSTIMSLPRSREKDTISIASTAVASSQGGVGATLPKHLHHNNPFPPSTTCISVTSETTTCITSTGPTSSSLLDLKPRLSPNTTIPLTFGPYVFDDAERAVKYIVLTNTWPKFVAAGFASKGSRDKERVKLERAGNGGFYGLKGYGGGGQRWARLWDGVSCNRK